MSPTDQCFICEKWKYTVFFYDRKRYYKNKLLNCVTRYLIELVNKHMKAEHHRRVSPTIVAPTLISHQGSLQMGNLLEYSGRLNRSICKQLEQTYVNSS